VQGLIYACLDDFVCFFVDGGRERKFGKGGQKTSKCRTILGGFKFSQDLVYMCRFVKWLYLWGH